MARLQGSVHRIFNRSIFDSSALFNKISKNISSSSSSRRLDMTSDLLNNVPRIMSCEYDQRRLFSSHLDDDLMDACAGLASTRGLVLGVYGASEDDPTNYHFTFTPTADKYNKSVGESVRNMMSQSGPIPRPNQVRLLFGVEGKHKTIAIVGLGPECMSYNDNEQLDENKERIRQAAAAGTAALQSALNVENIYIESFGHAESSAEGAAMGVWLHQEFMKSERRLRIPTLNLFDDCDITGWQIGLHKGAAQNVARQLIEAPPNLMTPKQFAELSIKLLNTHGINVGMKIKNWLNTVGMNSLLAVGKGSCHDPVLVEASYYGCDPSVPPVILIGKGTTFDCGGLCLKKDKGIRYKRNDMAGAAVVIGALRAVSALQLPMNIVALLPLSENMIGPNSIKPGDTIRTLSGKTVRLHDTDTQSRLGVVDILTYASTYKPKFILDVGTISQGIKHGLGSAATGVWTNNEELWEQMRVASVHTGDRVWRMPLWKHFSDRVTWSDSADMKDVKTNIGSACLSAAFLEQFICGDWIHLDIYGVTMASGKSSAYLKKGMSGRPVRTVVEFLAQFACKPGNEKKAPMKKQPEQKTKNNCCR